MCVHQPKGKPVFNMERLIALAAVAYPKNERDWGSERQVEAENAFFDEIGRDDDGECTVIGDDFPYYCLKATTCEMIDEALRRVSSDRV